MTKLKNDKIDNTLKFVISVLIGSAVSLDSPNMANSVSNLEDKKLNN